MSEEQLERAESAHDRYDRKNTRRVSLKFNKNTDAEILAWIDKQGSIQGAIKDAIMYKIRSEQGER